MAKRLTQQSLVDVAFNIGTVKKSKVMEGKRYAGRGWVNQGGKFERNQGWSWLFGCCVGCFSLKKGGRGPQAPWRDHQAEKTQRTGNLREKAPREVVKGRGKGEGANEGGGGVNVWICNQTPIGTKRGGESREQGRRTQGGSGPDAKVGEPIQGDLRHGTSNGEDGRRTTKKENDRRKN